MFTDIPAQPPKFRIILHKPLHIGNALNIHITLRLGLEIIHIFLDIGTEVTEIEVHVFMEEGILIGVQDDFPQFRADVGDVGEGDAAVVDGEEIVDHGLVGPLGEEGAYRVVATVEN
jgi:hypothetical protein